MPKINLRCTIYLSINKHIVYLLLCNFYFTLFPYLYDLVHMNAENAKTCIQEVIKEKYNKFEKNKTRKMYYIY